MAIQFSEDMLNRMGESQRKQTLEMLKQMDEEQKQEQPTFRVQLYEEYGDERYFLLKEAEFNDEEKAVEFAEYLDYKEPVEFGKIIIIDNNGEVIDEVYTSRISL